MKYSSIIIPTQNALSISFLSSLDSSPFFLNLPTINGFKEEIKTEQLNIQARKQREHWRTLKSIFKSAPTKIQHLKHLLKRLKKPFKCIQAYLRRLLLSYIYNHLTTLVCQFDACFLFYTHLWVSGLLVSLVEKPFVGSWLSSLKTKLGFFGDPIKNQRE